MTTATGPPGPSLPPITSLAIPNSDLRTSFTALPDELLLSIFALVPAATRLALLRVCRAARRLALDRSAWDPRTDETLTLQQASVVARACEACGVAVLSAGPRLVVRMLPEEHRLAYYQQPWATPAVGALIDTAEYQAPNGYFLSKHGELDANVRCVTIGEVPPLHGIVSATGEITYERNQNDIRYLGLSLMGKFPQLRVVSLRFGPAADSLVTGVHTLLMIPLLEELYVYNWYMSLSRRAVDETSSYPHLRIFHANRTRAGEGFFHASRFPALRELVVGRSPHHTESALFAGAPPPLLERLTLAVGDILMYDYPCLKDLEFVNEPTDKLVDVCLRHMTASQFPRLTRLILNELHARRMPACETLFRALPMLCEVRALEQLYPIEGYLVPVAPSTNVPPHDQRETLYNTTPTLQYVSETQLPGLKFLIQGRVPLKITYSMRWTRNMHDVHYSIRLLRLASGEAVVSRVFGGGEADVAHWAAPVEAARPLRLLAARFRRVDGSTTEAEERIDLEDFATAVELRDHLCRLFHVIEARRILYVDEDDDRHKITHLEDLRGAALALEVVEDTVMINAGW